MKRLKTYVLDVGDPLPEGTLHWAHKLDDGRLYVTVVLP